MCQVCCPTSMPTDLVLQARRRKSAPAHPHRSSATPKHAEHALELMEEEAGPFSAALAAQHMAADAQQDKTPREASQGGATAGGPAAEVLQHAGIGQPGEGYDREAPKTLASRISRFFTGRKSMPETPTGKSFNLNWACSDHLCCFGSLSFDRWPGPDQVRRGNRHLEAHATL